MKDKNRVLKEYPTAKLHVLDNGTYVIIHNDVVLAEEYYMPDALTEDDAWKYAALTCKTTQQFNRTHPLRMDLSTLETKLTRIQRRKRNAKKNK